MPLDLAVNRLVASFPAFVQSRSAQARETWSADFWTHPAASIAREAKHVKDIFTLRLYTRVARLGSFSAAARECGLSQSRASRIIADLEADLGTRLLSRSTRAVVPTEAGGEFLARIESIMGALDEAEYSVRGGGDLRGLVRMSMPTSFGLRTVIPRIAAFTAKYPDLNIHLLLEDLRRGLVRGAGVV